ncbi:MAG: hypothetical protein H0W23_05000 [Chloroflexia bacterium]|nr:hypothetical protein [Chloroflexia bacterium]
MAVWPGYDRRYRPVRRLLRYGVLIAAIVGVVFMTGELSAVPATKAGVEEHLERSLLAYAPLDDAAYVVFQLGDTVYLDVLTLDWISIEWPPTPRWQWSGMWSYIDATTAPASVAIGNPNTLPVLFGQINDPGIVTFQAEVDGQWQSFPVSGAGFVVQLPAGDTYSTRYRWLDAGGNVVYEINDAVTAGP